MKPLELESRLALRPAEAARALGLSERALRALLPQLPVVRAGGAVLIPIEQLREWLRERAQFEGHEATKAVQDACGKISTVGEEIGRGCKG